MSSGCNYRVLFCLKKVAKYVHHQGHDTRDINKILLHSRGKHASIQRPTYKR